MGTPPRPASHELLQVEQPVPTAAIATDLDLFLTAQCIAGLGGHQVPSFRGLP